MAPAAVYLLLHVTLRYGAAGSVVYIGPFDAPKQFFSEALLRMPAMIATELLLVPGEQFYGKLLTRAPEAATALVPIGLIATLAIVTYLRAEPRRRRLLATAALGSLLGLLPLVGTIPSVRLLLIASFGGSALIGAILWDALTRLGDPAERRRVASLAFAFFCLPVAAVHLGFALRFTHDHAIFWRSIVSGIRHKHLAAEIDDREVAQQELVLINSGGEIASLIYPPYVRHARGSPMPRRWRVLCNAPSPQHVVRVADDTLELSVEKGHMFEDPTSQMFRAPSLPFHVGDHVSIPGLDVRVLEVEGWAPSKVRYRFDTSLDDPKRVFLVLENGRMRRALMPPVGGEFVVPPFG
ncbi:MAG: hypothetical protein U0263_09600 [Polyangiaceae bacterium]